MVYIAPAFIFFLRFHNLGLEFAVREKKKRKKERKK